MSKNLWITSAILIVIISFFVGTSISSTNLLDFMTPPEKTEQVEISDSPWTQQNNLLTTELIYDSPGDLEKNTISIALDENNLITSFDMTIETSNDVSIAYQTQFISQVKETIIGKKASEIAQIDTIAGASLTTQAFTDAFSQL